MEKRRKQLPDIFPPGIYELCVLELVIVVVTISCLLGGCSIEQTDGTKISDLSYTILKEEEIPQELLAQIEEKKASDFKMTYETDDSLYIVRGYGEQETGGYSISVKELYLTRNAIFLDSNLIGPRKGEKTAQNPSFPYLVIKTELREENVVFE